MAGAASLEFGLFSFFAYGGGCLWAVTFITVGIFVGDRWEILAQRLQASGWFLAVVIAVAAVLFFMFHRKLKKR